MKPWLLFRVEVNPETEKGYMNKAACASVIVDIEVKSWSENRRYETLVITRVEVTPWYWKDDLKPHMRR